MAKHTSGPYWRDDDGFIAAGSGDTYVTLADFDCSNDIDIDEREANKDLFIAAPELLEACKEAHSLIHDLNQGGANNPEEDILARAIAHAEGKER